ncbi:MAG: YggS family pyridoxal phosphate-dependent enzyme [Herpetosiphon sp.]
MDKQLPGDAADFAARKAIVEAAIAAAARRAGRTPTSITLLAVTKTHPASVIELAAAGGIIDVGENRVQEAAAKRELLDAHHPALHWHLIGPLQRNKARKAATLFDLIHTVDSVELAAMLNGARQATARPPLPILLQVNVGGEQQKAGWWLPGGVHPGPDLDRFTAAVETIVQLPFLNVQGLMTVPPFADDMEATRPFFVRLRELRDDLRTRFGSSQMPHLSMGMSNDYPVAIEEGATIVRVGTALFGRRS